MMSRAALAAIAVATVLGTNSFGSEAGAAVLRVGTYNIFHGVGEDNALDLGRIANVIQGMDVDVIGLQEIDFSNSRTGFVDQPAVIAQGLNARTGGNWTPLAAPAINFAGGQYGNAVLFDADRLTLSNYSVTGLPDPLGDGARSVANATFGLNGVAFQFLATHLTNRNAPSANASTVQLDSVAIIDSLVEPSMAAILVGDMNASIDPADNSSLATMQRLLDLGWTIDSPTVGTTFLGGQAVIDYVLSKNGGMIGLAALDSEIIVNGLTNIASDHYPVVTEYNIDSMQVPAPAGLPVMAVGLGALALLTRRNRASH